MGKEEQGVSAEDLPSKCQSLRLRSIRKRIETEQNKLLPKTRRPRERPAPLSKYRRRTANARERQRMQEVNVAFEKLKSTIPHHKLKQIDEKKDTKITTLRCAITYINSLSELLEDIEKGKPVSPEYHFTDAQLGLEPENKKKRNQKGKDRGHQIRNKKDSQHRKRKTTKIENMDITKQLEHIDLPPEIRMLLANTLNKSKKFNNSSPYMIDNRPKTVKRRKRDLSLKTPSNQLVLVSNNSNANIDNTVLQTIISNNQQNVINVNDGYSGMNCANTLKPILIPRRNLTVNKEQENSFLLFNDEIRGNVKKDVSKLISPTTNSTIQHPSEIRFNELTPVIPCNINISSKNNSVIQNSGLLKSSPPAAVLALVRGTSVEKVLQRDSDMQELQVISNSSSLPVDIPFSTKGLQPMNSIILQRFVADSSITKELSIQSPSSTQVPHVPSNYPTSPTSSSVSSSPSLFTVNYQNDDKIENTGQDHYLVSDDISELTPSITTIDLEHQLMNSIDYNNAGSMQEFLVEFENSSDQASQNSAIAIVEGNNLSTAGILG